MSGLNDKQQEAVLYTGTPLLVLAGAGSGKTTVITRKIAYLIETCGIKAHHIAAVTFTNKASREMKARVGKLVKGGAARGLTVSTFHNLGLNIIRREHKTLGYKSGFSIFDQHDCQTLIKDLLATEYETNAELVDYVQHTISNWKNQMTSEAQAASLADTASELVAAQIYQRYNNALKAYNAVDFDDLILVPAQLFDNFPAILEKWQRKVRYLLVDEYQDTNMAQYKLVKQLVGNRGTLTVVGDDDQSIYAWRGARPENLAQLKVDYPDLHLIKLEQNYRSTSRILQSANHLITHNPHDFDKALWSNLGLGDEIRVVRCGDEEKEAERVASEITHRHLTRKIQYRDFAILYRGNHQSRLLEMKLQTNQIPYHINGGTSFFGRHEIKDLMSYLRLLINPDDDNAFLRVINTPRRGIGAVTLEKLATYANQRDTSMYNASGELGLASQLNDNQLEPLQRFNHWLEKVRENCERGDPIGAIREMVEDIDYEAWLHQNASSARAAERQMENVWYLMDALRQTLERAQEDDDDAGIEEAIAKLILRDMLERQEEENDDDKVQLMTLHASKGLEFPHVYMIGLEEELLPHRSSIEEDNIEEERRLMYVGITRAQKTLTLTLADSRKSFGEQCGTTPSRFIDELPDDHVQYEGFEHSDPSINQKSGKETLAGLKSLFD